MSALVPVGIRIKTDCFQKNQIVRALDARCLNDIVKVLSDLSSVVSDVEQFNIAGAIAAAKAVVPDAQKAISECGSSNDVMTFSAACVTDVTGIIDDLGSIVVDVKDSQWPKVFIDASDIVKKGIAFKADCIDA